MSKTFRDQNIEHNQKLFRRCLTDLKKGSGAVIGISGETGFGKTHLLNMFSIEAGKHEDIMDIFVEGLAPIGNFNVGNIQPLLPFTHALEKIMSSETGSAEKKFARNLLMTGLSVVPLAGDLFWAIKEAGKDWRQFKRDKSSEKARKVSTATADYYDTIRSFAEKAPIVIMMDDMQWCDAQSVELLGMLADEILEIPLILVFTYRPDIVRSSGSPLLRFIEKYVGSKKNVYGIDLKPFDKKQIHDICAFFLPDYKGNTEFENWVYDHSYGIPGVVAEYMKFFLDNPPFDGMGNLIEGFADGDFVPTTLQSTFAQSLGKLSLEERNVLAICSAEGREFTALISSELLNTDVLSAIKKLRGLQDKTGIIRSVGAKIKYGVKTTTYRFTQAFYHTYFEKSLEFEEHVAIHGQIAALLKQRYDEAEDERTREQIAPYLAAHSSESGDEETTKSMLLASAKAARKYGSAEIIKKAYENYVNVGNLEGIEPAEDEEAEELDTDDIAFREMVRKAERDSGIAPDENGENGSAGSEGTEAGFSDTESGDKGDTPDIIIDTDFSTIRKAIVKEYHNGDYNRGSEIAVSYLEGKENELDSSEKAQLLSLAAKSHIETGQLEEAESLLGRAGSEVEESGEDIAECFYLNTIASLRSAQGRLNDAYAFLEEAAKKVIALPTELRLLTITNIALILKEISPRDSGQYMEAARQLCRDLNYEELMEDLAG